MKKSLVQSLRDYCRRVANGYPILQEPDIFDRKRISFGALEPKFGSNIKSDPEPIFGFRKKSDSVLMQARPQCRAGRPVGLDP